MKREYELSSSKFIYSKDEFGYQEVLDDFDNANQIVIITYNISSKRDYLLNQLIRASEHAKIHIFTNIPAWWEDYYGDSYKNMARSKINFYLSKLNPEKLGKEVGVFFNFENHGKIIMTDNIVYIGSSNFSDESKNNIEFGIISKDKEFINYLSEIIFYDIEKESIPYYEYDYMPLVLEFELNLSNLFILKNELFDQIYSYYDDLDGQGYYYNDVYDSLSFDTLEKLYISMCYLQEIIKQVYDAIDDISNGDNDKLDTVNKFYENTFQLISDYEENTYNTIVYDLAIFETNEQAIQILADEFSLEAYDEYLEEYIQISMDIANEQLTNLCNQAESYLDTILKIIDEFIENGKECIDFFRQFESRKVNDLIDNT